VRSSEVVQGRSIVAVFEHGEDFMEALIEACEVHVISQAFIPSFVAGFAEAELVGTCGGLEQPQAPLWQTVRVEHVEALGSGTIARNTATGHLHPHIHSATGLKGDGASGRTSHLVSARVQFLTELLIIELLSPQLVRRPDPSLFDVPLLGFAQS
jgi:predicted DNA-binding protein with PD1-like motif